MFVLNSELPRVHKTDKQRLCVCLCASLSYPCILLSFLFKGFISKVKSAVFKFKAYQNGKQTETVFEYKVGHLV